MKFKNKLLYIIIIVSILIIFGICIILNNNGNKFKKVNMLSGSIEQTKDYKLYEFGISDNKICQNIDEMVNQVVNDYSEYIDFEYVDVTKNLNLSNIYNINSIPTFIIVDIHGNVKYRMSGSVSKEELIKFINKITK